MLRFLAKTCCLLLTGAAALLSISCAPQEERGLEGQLLFQDKPLSGAQVEIYLKAEKDRSVQPFAVAGTDAGGHFRVTLPEGHYFVIGKKRDTGEDGRVRMLMAESPGNPHGVAERFDRVTPFNLREMGRQGLVADAGTGVSGRVMIDDKPVGRAYVYVYTRAESGLIGPSYGEAMQTGPDGRFSIDLPAGQYYLVARKRAAGGRSGELKPGDFNSAYPDNPVTVPRGERVDLGGFSLSMIDATTRAEREAQGTFAATDTLVTGEVRDADGEPISGVYVFAYLDSRMVGKPVHISAPSDPGGRFQLFLADGGVYYIGARSAYGGPLEPGEWVGTYDDRPDHALEVPANSRTTLGTITVREVW